MVADIEQQQKNKRLVETHIYCNVSQLIEECFEKEVFGFEEIQNLEKSEQELLDEGYTKEEIKDGQMNEILEWWIVSDWLAEKLKAKGEPILKGFINYFWGRTTTGQAIFLDSVITEIEKER